MGHTIHILMVNNICLINSHSYYLWYILYGGDRISINNSKDLMYAYWGLSYERIHVLKECLLGIHRLLIYNES